MSMRKSPRIAVLLALAFGSGAAFAVGPNLGRPVDPAEIAAWDISIQPDGTGLPPGGGTPLQGARIFAQKCAMCHGEDAKGGANAALVGGAPIANMDSVRTIANFWPYSTTVFDYIRRAMPWQQPRTLTDNVLTLNMLIGETDSINAETLPKVPMPNRNGFIIRIPEKI